MRPAALAAAAGVALFLACCSLPWVGLWNPGGVADTGLYGLYGGRMADGLVPYRDFFVEFPPGALLALVVPALPGSHYVVWFKVFEFLCGAATIVLLATIVARIETSRVRLYSAVALAAVAPAVLGPISLNSFDYWPALLTTAAVAALVADRHTTGFALLGVATAAKLFPAGLLAVALLFTLHRAGRARWRAPLLAYLGAVALVFAPFAILGPGGLRFSLRTQLARGLQLESLGASLLAAAHHLGHYRPSYTPNLAYAQLAGPAASAVAAVSTVVMLAAVALVAWLYHRTAAGEGDLVYAAAATVAGILAFAKVLSPQYLLWLVPLVAAASTRSRWSAALLLLALGLTQVWVPDRFRELQSMGWVTWALLARNLVLVSLYALLVAQLRARSVAGAGAEPRRARARARPWPRTARPPRRGRTA